MSVAGVWEARVDGKQAGGRAHHREGPARQLRRTLRLSRQVGLGRQLRGAAACRNIKNLSGIRRNRTKLAYHSGTTHQEGATAYR